MKKIGRLHVITDTVLQSAFSHTELTVMAIEGGADTIQFRQKEGSTREMAETAVEMKNVCRRSGIPFIVNDRIDIAILAEADGVHLGQDDFPIPKARSLLGKEVIIGGSAASLDEAKKCLVDGADYIGFGPVYPTTSKDDAAPVTGIKLMRGIIDAIPLPIIAIGGISPENTSAIIREGAHGIAVISAVCCQNDPVKATQALYKALT